MDKKVVVDGIKVNYKQEGKGEPIVILHGWGGSSDSWQRVLEILAQNKFEVISLDLPGFGKSEDPKEPWTINNYIKFILSFLENIGIKGDFYLLGHSFGGGIAVKLAAENPVMIKKLILCDSAVVRAKQRLNFRQKTAKCASKIAKPFLTSSLYKKKVYPILRPVIYRVAGNYDYFSANETMKQTFKKIFAEDLRAFASFVRAQTLITWGENDKITPIEDAYSLNSTMPNSELKIIKEVGHAPHLKKPEELSDVIIEFLNRED